MSTRYAVIRLRGVGAALPPVLVGADVGGVQDLLDGLLLVARAGRSTRASVTSAVQQPGAGRLHGVMMLELEPRFMPG